MHISEYNRRAVDIWERYCQTLSPEEQERFGACTDRIKADIRRVKASFLRSGPSRFTALEQKEFDQIMSEDSSRLSRAKSQAAQVGRKSSSSHRRRSRVTGEVWYTCGVCVKDKGAAGFKRRKQADVRDHVIRMHELEPRAWRDIGGHEKVSSRHQTAAAALVREKLEAYDHKKTKDLERRRLRIGPSSRSRGRPRVSERSRSPRRGRASTRRPKRDRRSTSESSGSRTASDSHSESPSPPRHESERRRNIKRKSKRKSSVRNRRTPESAGSESADGSEVGKDELHLEEVEKVKDASKGNSAMYEAVSDPEPAESNTTVQSNALQTSDQRNTGDAGSFPPASGNTQAPEGSQVGQGRNPPSNSTNGDAGVGASMGGGASWQRGPPTFPLRLSRSPGRRRQCSRKVIESVERELGLLLQTAIP